MRRVLPLILVASLVGATHFTAVAQEAVRFDRPIFTTSVTALCPSQGDITTLRRASDTEDKKAFERLVDRTCKSPGPDIRLTIITTPGLYDPDVEVRIAAAPNLDPSLPRGKVWTLKTMIRN
jgi:hypothetical protein